MKHSIKIQGAREFEKLLRRYPSEMAKESNQILRSEARLLASEYGGATSPPDLGGEAAVQGFRDRIEKENKRVFATRENPRAVYALLKIHAPDKAAAYWHAIKSNKFSSALAILRTANVPQGKPAIELLAGLRGYKGRIIAGKRAVLLTRSSELRKFIRGRQSHIGTAKAAWLQAAQGVGGRVRRGNKERFPKYVRQASRLFSGIGGALVSTGRVVIWSNVSYASDALDPRLKATAESLAADRLTIHLDAMCTHFAEKASQLKIA